MPLRSYLRSSRRCRNEVGLMASRISGRSLVGAVALVLACAAVGTALLSVRRSGKPHTPTENGATPKVFEVRLANRTIRVTDDDKGNSSSYSFDWSSGATSARGTKPFVLVSGVRVDGSVRNRAAMCGARVSGVIPPFGLVVEADHPAMERLRKDGTFMAAEALGAEDKMSESLKDEMSASVESRIAVTVIPLQAKDASAIVAYLGSIGSKIDGVSTKGRGFVKAEVSAAHLRELAGRGDVRWVERHERAVLLNDVVVRPGLMNVTPVRDTYGLTGLGQVVTISDTGLDTGNAESVMADFSGKIAFMGTVSGSLGYDLNGHGTHVAGSLAGDGALSSGAFRGVAPSAMLNVWQCADAAGNLFFPENDLLFQPDRKNSPSYIHSASWGSKLFSEYDSYSISVDDWLWRHPENLALFAVGNSGGNSRVYSPAGAKNVIAVGATESLRKEKGTSADNPSSVATFSSKGPMLDGRIKPDLCAPGTYVMSTRSSRTSSTGKGLCTTNSNYMFDSGTSMSTPLVSGAAALVRQWLMERRGYTNELPTAALIKAVLTGGAYDMSADSDARCGGAAPNSSQGWGRVDLGESIYPTNTSIKLVDRVPFADGETFRVRIATTNESPLAVQLVWTDYPGEYGAALSLVNDLDLVVSNETTGAVWYGNGVENGDRTNSVECVRVQSAPAGEYSVLVKGTAVPYDCMEGGAAALFIRGAIRESDASDEPETVSITVSVDGDAAAETMPSIGRHRVTKGAPVTLNAEDLMIDDGGGNVVKRRPVAGWTGEGDVPASGEGGRVTVRLNRDSSVRWKWNDCTNVLMRAYAMIPSYGDYYLFYDESWPLQGAVLKFVVPESVPGGSETIDASEYGFQYKDEDGVTKAMTQQRLGRIEVAATGSADTTLIMDGHGHMATEFSLKIDDGTDILYYFYDEKATNVATSLPAWWYQRYVALDPAADQVWFTSVSPKLIEWTGGAGRKRVLERTGSLGGEVDWRPVYTNNPMPVLTNRWEVPAAYSTDSFYRITVE